MFIYKENKLNIIPLKTVSLKNYPLFRILHLVAWESTNIQSLTGLGIVFVILISTNIESLRDRKKKNSSWSSIFVDK
jgi:hypothetical protein